MPDREKVINELVSYIENALGVDSDYVDCIPTDLLQHAVALLKEQEPRVMTLEETDALTHRTIETGVYLERREDLNIYAAIAGNTQGIVPNLSWMGKKRNFLDEYGEMWRCWTARPTDKQRGETPWKK